MGRIKFKINPIIIIAFLLYHSCFINLYYVSEYKKIMVLCIIPTIIYFIFKAKEIVLEKYKKINLLLFIFSAILLFSSLLNWVNIDGTIWFILKLWCVFIFWEHVNERKLVSPVLAIYILLSVFYTVYSLYYYNLDESLFYYYDRNFFVGNKFDLSYLAFLSFIFLKYYYVINNKNGIKPKMLLMILWIFSIYVSSFTGCSTMLLGNFLAIFLLKLVKSSLLYKTKNVVILLIISSVILLFFSTIITNIEFVRNFIVNVLKKDVSLTGRVEIYENIFPIIGEKIFFGYSYGNSFYTLMEKISAPNAQNALLDWWIMSGIFGVIVIVNIIIRIFKNVNILGNEKLKPIVVGIYTFIFLGMVEITINITFFTLLAILNIGVDYTKKLEGDIGE